jgi:toxin FitB
VGSGPRLGRSPPGRAVPLAGREGVIPGDREVAKVWGEVVTYADKPGRPRPVNDSWIAACCLTYGLPLATLNVADFQDFADHEGLELITP